MKRVFKLIVAALIFIPAFGVSADDIKAKVDLCWSEKASADIRINACTWLEKSGRLDRERLLGTLLRRAIAHHDKGQYNSAIQDYSRVIRLKPDDVNAYYSRGLTYKKIGKLDRAISDLSEAVRLAPNVALFYKTRADIYRKNQDYEAEISDYKAVRSIEPPEEIWDILPLAIALREAGKLDEALREISYAAKFDEDGPGTGPGMAYHVHLGKTLHKKGLFEKAIEAFTNGIPKQPSYYYVRFHRALSYEAVGDLLAAKTDLQYVLQKELAFRRNAGLSIEDIDSNLREALRRFQLHPK